VKGPLRRLDRDAMATETSALLDELDIRVGAVSALRRRHDVDPRRIALVGASIGGSAAVWATGVDRRVPVRAAVGLSAVEGPALIDVATKGRFRPHDLLLIADRKSSPRCRTSAMTRTAAA
jgi:pimeloyl-ACP methyl ester carboxylesterase